MSDFQQTTFLGASVANFNGNLGWGGDPSTVTITLVEDDRNNDAFDPPMMGAPCYFQLGNFQFDGLLTNVQESRGQGGNRLLEVTLQDPRQILDGVQLIIGAYNGPTAFIPNLYNIFGYYENMEFGRSKVNESGMPWYLIKGGFYDIMTSGNLITFNGYSYFLDLTYLPYISDTYRVQGTNVSMLAFIQEVCDIANYEFFFELVGNTISLKTINRNRQSISGAIKRFLDSVEGANALNSGFELEYNTTSKFVVGAQVETVLFQNANSVNRNGPVAPAERNIWPYWGLDRNGNAILGTGEGYDHQFTLDGLYITYPQYGIDFSTGYTTDVKELCAVAISKEAWIGFLSLNDIEDTIHFGKLNKIGCNSATIADNLADIFKNSNNFGNTLPKDFYNFKGVDENIFTEKEEIVDRIYNYLRVYATEYLGKKYMVRIPDVVVKYDEETQNYTATLEPIESGYIEESLFNSAVANRLLPENYINVTTEENKLKSYVRFDARQAGRVDVTQISTDSLTVSGDSVFVNANIEPKLVFLNSSTVSSPRAVITLPGVIPLYTKDRFTFAESAKAAFTKVTGVDDLLTADDDDSKNFRKKISMVGNAGMLLGADPLPLIPNMAAIPLKNNLMTYGPWYSVGGDGKVEFEQNEDLVPWKYGGFANLATVGKAISSTLNNRFFGETGSLTVPGIPSGRLGSELIAGGPFITGLEISIDSSGVTTNYRMQKWNVKPGQDLQHRLGQLQKYFNLKTQQRRIFRQLFTPGRPLNNFIFPIKPKTISDYLAPKTPHHILVSEILDGDYKACSVVSSSFKDLKLNLSKNNWNRKAGVSLDGLFRPYSTDPSETHLPHFETPTYNGQEPNITSYNPYRSGNDIGVVFSGDEPGSHINNSNSDGTYEYPEHVRSVALKGPLIIAGTGFDTAGAAVGEIDDCTTWKVGPLDTRWDDEKKIWIAGGAKINVGVLETVAAQRNGTTLYSGLINTMTIGLGGILSTTGDKVWAYNINYESIPAGEIVGFYQEQKSRQYVIDYDDGITGITLSGNNFYYKRRGVWTLWASGQIEC